MNFFCSLSPMKQSTKSPRKIREHSEQNSGQNSGRKFEKFGELSFCNFSDLTEEGKTCESGRLASNGKRANPKMGKWPTARNVQKKENKDEQREWHSGSSKRAFIQCTCEKTQGEERDHHGRPHDQSRGENGPEMAKKWDLGWNFPIFRHFI